MHGSLQQGGVGAQLAAEKGKERPNGIEKDNKKKEHMRGSYVLCCLPLSRAKASTITICMHMLVSLK